MASDHSGAAGPRPAPAAQAGRAMRAGSPQQLQGKSREFSKARRTLGAAAKKVFGNSKKTLDTSGQVIVKGSHGKKQFSKGGREKKKFLAIARKHLTQASTLWHKGAVERKHKQKREEEKNLKQAQESA